MLDQGLVAQQLAGPLVTVPSPVAPWLAVHWLAVPWQVAPWPVAKEIAPFRSCRSVRRDIWAEPLLAVVALGRALLVIARVARAEFQDEVVPFQLVLQFAQAVRFRCCRY